MEELNTSMFRFGVGLAYEDRRLRIYLRFPHPSVRLDFDMEYFLLHLRDIDSTISLHTRDGILSVEPEGKDACLLVFYNMRSPLAHSVRVDLGLLNYRDLLTAINMELNTLCLRERREEVFKSPMPRWRMDGGPF
jgi:hypothetical protein